MTGNSGGDASSANIEYSSVSDYSTEGYMISQGRRVHVKHIDRGEPLIYSREQWRARSNHITVLPLAILEAYLIIFTIFVIAAIDVPIEDMIIPLGLCGLILILIAWLAFGLYIRAHQAPLGIYSKGIELLTGIGAKGKIFLPYGEIGEVIKPILPIYIVHLHGRYTKRKWNLNLMLYNINSTKIVREMVKRQKEGPVQEGPPKLVLYSARGPRR